MNDPNYDDYNDFHDDRAERFIEKVFGADDPNPAVKRNPGCKFTETVLDYLQWEWEIEILDYPHEIQDRAIDMIDMMTRRRSSVPSTAARIANEIIPI